MPPRILSIAGSDSGGGAGIQADIKTITSLGGYAMTAVTALTAQNTTGVKAIQPVPSECVSQQIDAVLEDIGADVIKTGMLHSADVILATLSSLSPYDSIPLVVDPVMVAKGGSVLLADDAIEVVRSQLIPVTTLLTPNIPEAEVLLGTSITSLETMKTAVASLHSLGADAVLLKGGHLCGDTVYDILYDGNTTREYTSPRLHTLHTHGTGCTLSAAIATFLGLGHSLAESVDKAREFVHHAIETAPGFGAGHGPLNHLQNLSRF